MSNTLLYNAWVEDQLVRVMLAGILYLEGLKYYVKVHLASQPWPLLSLTSLCSVEEKLPAVRFMRIHRSYIVGLDHVAAVGRGTLQVRQETLQEPADLRRPGRP